MFPPLTGAQPETDALEGLLYSTCARNNFGPPRFQFANSAPSHLQRELSLLINGIIQAGLDTLFCFKTSAMR
jgi:hypothetical protein